MKETFLRKVSLLMVISVLLMSLSTVALAAPPEGKGGGKDKDGGGTETESSVTLQTPEPISVEVGKEVALTVRVAVNERNYTDTWSTTASLGEFQEESFDSKKKFTNATFVYRANATVGIDTVKIQYGDTALDYVEFEINVIASSTEPPTDPPTEPPVEPTTVKYLALGDSIPYGTTYDIFDGSDPDYKNIDGISEYSYVDYFANALSSQYDIVDVTNLSVVGWEAKDVLDQLTNVNNANYDEVVNLIQNSDVISLGVGANEIMNAAQNSEENFEFYNIDWNVANAGREAFEGNWAEIISTIENIIAGINEDVILEVITIYNPYNSDDTRKNTTPYDSSNSNESIHDQVDHYFSDSLLDGDSFDGLNTIIKSTDTSLDYRVIDVYQYFEDKYLSNKGAVTGFYGLFLGKDPHPDKNGQTIIGQFHLDTFKEVQSDYIIY